MGYDDSVTTYQDFANMNNLFDFVMPTTFPMMINFFRDFGIYFTFPVMIFYGAENATDEKQFVCSKDSINFWFVFQFDREMHMIA